MSKLTLSVDAAVAERAKRYAAENGTSVSQLVETYLSLVTKPPEPEPDTPLLREVRGILRKGSREDYRKYLVKKYLGK